MRRLGLIGQSIAVLVVAIGLLAVAAQAFAADTFIAPTRDIGLIQRAIDSEKPSFVPPAGVTGISVPHHMLAANLIARGFWAASQGQYDRVIVLSPDHFHRVKGKFATTTGDLDTVFGTLGLDRPDVDTLLKSPDFENIPDIGYEHGQMAIAPFIKHFFPNATVVPVIAAVSTTEADWQDAAALLAPMVGPHTLIVQSTDYSHYLPLPTAIERDQETLATIAAGDDSAVPAMLQPGHVNSKAAQYIQMDLQKRLWNAASVVVANSNSAAYGANPDFTTSYVVTVYLKNAAAASVLTYPDQTRVFFGGDVLLGRYFTPFIADPGDAAGIVHYLDGITDDAPLLINLEGVLLDQDVNGLSPDAHLMQAHLAVPILQALHVTAASLANNHANDLGTLGREESIRLLAAGGITPLPHAQLHDFGGFRVLALDFVDGKFSAGQVASPDDLDFVCHLNAAPPLVAFVHWGIEYTAAFSATEQAIARKLAACGVTAIVGDHSHQASSSLEAVNGSVAAVYSLGNLIFDQSAAHSTGALLELRAFKQGTVALRLIPIENLFNTVRAAAR